MRRLRRVVHFIRFCCSNRCSEEHEEYVVLRNFPFWRRREYCEVELFFVLHRTDTMIKGCRHRHDKWRGLSERLGRPPSV